MRILICEENIRIREEFRNIFTQMGSPIRIIEAGNACHALEILKNEPIDVVFLNIWLPENGVADLPDLIAKNWPSTKVLYLERELIY